MCDGVWRVCCEWCYEVNATCNEFVFVVVVVVDVVAAAVAAATAVSDSVLW